MNNSFILFLPSFLTHQTFKLFSRHSSKFTFISFFSSLSLFLILLSTLSLGLSHRKKLVCDHSSGITPNIQTHGLMVALPSHSPPFLAVRFFPSPFLAVRFFFLSFPGCSVFFLSSSSFYLCFLFSSFMKYTFFDSKRGFMGSREHLKLTSKIRKRDETTYTLMDLRI